MFGGTKWASSVYNNYVQRTELLHSQLNTPNSSTICPVYCIFSISQNTTCSSTLATDQKIALFLPQRNSPQWAKASTLWRIHDHTQTHHSR